MNFSSDGVEIAERLRVNFSSDGVEIAERLGCLSLQLG